MRAKYLVKPGYVISKSDSDEHYISFTQLVRLYGVDERECLNFDNLQMRGNKDGFMDSLIILSPRFDGNYTLEGKK